MGVIGQTIIVCTTSTPYAVTGVAPDSMSQAQIGTFEPCMSRGSIVSSTEGVFYASPNGLVLASAGSVRVISTGLISKNKWLELLTVPKLKAARLGNAYYCFGSARSGMFEETAFDEDAFEQQDFTGAREGAMLEVNDARLGFMTLYDTEAASSVFSDPWSGEVLTLREGRQGISARCACSSMSLTMLRRRTLCATRANRRRWPTTSTGWSGSMPTVASCRRASSGPRARSCDPPAASRRTSGRSRSSAG
jgi:hypothetical protein